MHNDHCNNKEEAEEEEEEQVEEPVGVWWVDAGVCVRERERNRTPTMAITIALGKLGILSTKD